MSKSKSKKRTKAKQTVDQPKRDTLKLLRNGAIGLVVVAGAGVFGTRAVRATIAEQDLTRVGNGRPTIVQIHDPNCSLCTALQRETRKALKEVGEDRIQYLVANILTDEGAAFSRQYSVPHVTLLLFDGAGEMSQVIRGPQNKADLSRMFDAHLAQTGS